MYGDRYLIETPDQLLKKYNDAKVAKAPSRILTQILIQYIESEFRSDDLMRDYHLKLLHITPFLHNDIEEVLNFVIDDRDKLRKVYFDEWLSLQQMNYIVDTAKQLLIEAQYKYVESKSLNYDNQKRNQQQQQQGGKQSQQSDQQAAAAAT